MLAKLIIIKHVDKRISSYAEKIGVFIICPPEGLKRYADEELDEMAKDFDKTDDFGSNHVEHLAIINHHVSLGFSPKFATTQILRFDDSYEITTEIYMEMPCANSEIKK